MVVIVRREQGSWDPGRGVLYPNLPRKQRETAILQECPALFIVGIGHPLEDGYPHEMRAADYDDWVTPTRTIDGRPCHGLNSDILVWNHVTKRCHELSSMGIRAKILKEICAKKNIHVLE